MTKIYGSNSPRIIEHGSILDRKVYLEIKPVRYECDLCGSTTSELYDCCKINDKVNKPFKKYIMRNLIKITINEISNHKRH